MQYTVLCVLLFSFFKNMEYHESIFLILPFYTRAVGHTIWITSVFAVIQITVGRRSQQILIAMPAMV